MKPELKVRILTASDDFVATGVFDILASILYSPHSLRFSALLQHI